MNQEDNNQYKTTLFPICRTCEGPKIIQRCLRNNINQNFIPVPLTNNQTPEIETPEVIPSNTKSKGVCKFYLRNQCKNGKNCTWEHPKVCFSWTKNGICKNKEKCEKFLHPKLCWNEQKGIQCRHNCKFWHRNNKINSNWNFNNNWNMNKNQNQFSIPPPPVNIPMSFPNPPPSFPQTSSNYNNDMNRDFQNPQTKTPPDMSNQIWMLTKTVNNLQLEMRNMSKDVQVMKTNRA